MLCSTSIPISVFYVEFRIYLPSVKSSSTNLDDRRILIITGLRNARCLDVPLHLCRAHEFAHFLQVRWAGCRNLAKKQKCGAYPTLAQTSRPLLVF